MCPARAAVPACSRFMLASCLGLFCLACGSETGPEVGVVRFVVSTEGEESDLDPDGYGIEGFPAAMPAIPVTGDISVGDLPAGEYVLRLTGVAANCAAVNPERSVTVMPDDTVRVTWSLTCSPRTAHLTLTLTMPPDASAGRYMLAIGDRPRQALKPGDEVREQLAPGTYRIDLAGTPNCRLLGSLPQTVQLTSGSNVTLNLQAECSPGRLLFEWTGELWETAADGSGLRRVPGFEGYEVEDPSVSPQGDQLLFANYGVFLTTFDLATGTFHTLLSMSGIRRPVWSPDGSRIAFWAVDASSPTNADIYVVDRDGSNLRKLTDHPGPDINPTWSADGTRIAFDHELHH